MSIYKWEEAPANHRGHCIDDSYDWNRVHDDRSILSGYMAYEDEIGKCQIDDSTEFTDLDFSVISDADDLH